jgi:uncharacterized protein (TIGR00297 family)
MNLSPIQILAGFSFGVLVSYLAYQSKSLDKSGAAAAAISGGLIFGLGGISWAVLLLAFFISSSLISKIFHSQKVAASEKFSKGSRRDWAQVLANDGLGMFLVILHSLNPDQPVYWIAFAGSMAAVNADTWATEIGVLSPSSPILITTGKTVERGTSGGISLTGTGAAAAGALFIALTGVVTLILSSSVADLNTWHLLLAVPVSGLAGAMFDSLLGATVQVIYWCPDCRKETERHPLHICGADTEKLRGWSWLNNDMVNFLSSIMGAMAAVVLVYFF